MFTFYADPKAIVEERFAQFTQLGSSAETIREVAGRLKDLWHDGPGGWPYEWSRAAEAYESRGDWLRASLLYGIGKYPCLGDATRVKVYDKHLATYLRAAKTLPIHFDRRILTVPYRGGSTEVAAHLLSPAKANDKSPTLLMMGGIDTWKMDIHVTAAQVGEALNAHIALVDMVGVGESKLPLAADGNVVLAGVADQLRSLGNGRVGMFAFSFGATWAVKMALTGKIDAAAASGPLVADAFHAEFLGEMPNGMPGIIGNAFRRSAPFRDGAELGAAMAPFNMREQGLFDWRGGKTPLYVFNGANDPYVPNSDIAVFESRPDTVVKLLPNATHCAAEKIGELMPDLLRWLAAHLS
jgi:esterase FrsA